MQPPSVPVARWHPLPTTGDRATRNRTRGTTGRYGSADQRADRASRRRGTSATLDQDFGAGAAGGGTAGGVGAGVAPGAGTPGDLPKSTFGGALIAPSSATVKFGFTSILKTIAVRFVGNFRIVVLYSWTVLM